MIFNMTGGGASLNFTVKTYLSETELKADKPKENTIGVITTTTMTSWVFSGTEPTEAEVGMVWISVGNSSSVEFNALKNNTLQVYPLKAKQYEGRKWVDKVAYSYQDGEWVVWFTYLIKGADLCEGVTGGWTAHAIEWPGQTGRDDAPKLTKNSDSITLSLTEATWHAGVYAANNKINLDNVNKIIVNGFANDLPHAGVDLVVYSELGNDAEENMVATVAIGTANQTYELDVTELKGKYVIGIRLLSNLDVVATVTIKEIRM